MRNDTMLHAKSLLQSQSAVHLKSVIQGGRSLKRNQCCYAHKIVVLPGDGIGPEIASVAQKVLHSAGKACGEEFKFQEELIGGAAM